MSLKKVSVAIISVLLIACICVGFAFLLKPVESVGVASALEATLPNTGIVGENLIKDSYFTQFSDSDYWNKGSGSFTYNVLDDYINVSGTMATNRRSVFFINTGGVNYKSNDDFVVTLCFRVNAGSFGVTIVDNYDGGFATDYQVCSDSVTDGFLVWSYNFTSASRTGDYDFELYADYGTGNFDIDIIYIKVETGSSFTGYSIDTNGSYDDGYNDGYDDGYNAGVADGTQTGYDEGYEAGYDDGMSLDYQQGYDEGYEAGVADGTQTGYDDGYNNGYDDGYDVGVSDGLISANDIFVCSAVDIEYDKDKDYIYFNPNDVYSSYSNVMVNSFAMAFVPLSSLRYDDVDGGFYPVDIVRNSEGELPDVKTSAYYLVFNSLVEVGQWLLDNPNDYLCSYAITGEAEPAAIIFADLTRLDSFMSGSSVNYQNGYDDGYESGFVSGENTGYNKGYSAGYNKGTVEGSDYTFIGLIGSVLDAPISAFKGLLNFDILGVNMASFVTAILSLCVVIVVVKICMR